MNFFQHFQHENGRLRSALRAVVRVLCCACLLACTLVLAGAGPAPILDLTAAVVERISYDVWGQPRHHPRCDFDGDGDFDKSDADALDALILSGPVLITDAGYRPEMDLDRDGDVDAFDQALRGTTYIAALPRGALSSTGVGGVDNTVGWSGYRYDQPVRLYSVRFRFYDPVMFRWLNRDPAGYVDSMNLYGYGWGNPVGWFDPFGLGGPFFAGGAYIDGDGFITYDQMRMRGMSWEFRIYHFLLGFSDGWLDFWTFGLYTEKRKKRGLTPDWLQEESGWYRTGWWVGFGSAVVITAPLIAREFGYAAIADKAYHAMAAAIGANASALSKFMYLVRTGQGWRMIISPFTGKWLTPALLGTGLTPGARYLAIPLGVSLGWRGYEMGHDLYYWLFENEGSCD